MQFAIYCRKSKSSIIGDSLGNQAEMCRQAIAKEFSQEEADNALIFTDDGKSGKNMDRPAFKKMMDLVEKGIIQGICAYRLDRISRNVGEFYDLSQKLDEKYDVKMLFVQEKYNTATPTGKAMLMIASVFAQLERETTAERIRDNLHELAKSGRWLGGNTPTGFYSEKITHKNNKIEFKLTQISSEIKTVKLIYEKFLELRSLTKTEKFMMVNGYKTKEGNDFSRFAIRAILINPVYMIADKDAYAYICKNEIPLFADENDFDGKHGVMIYNRTLQIEKKATKMRPKNEWIAAIGKHKGVISGADWCAVQELLAENSSKNYNKPRTHVALLSGIVVCGQCGDYMRPKLSKRLNADGEKIYSYVCRKKLLTNGEMCQMDNPNGNMLDKEIMKKFKKYYDEADLPNSEINKLKKELRKSQANYQADIKEIEKQITSCEKSIARFYRDLEIQDDDEIRKGIYAKIKELKQEIENHKSNKLLLEASIKEKRLSEEQLDEVKNALLHLTADDLPIEEKRSIIKKHVKKIEWNGERARVFLIGEEGTYETPSADGKNPSCEDSE